MYLEVNGAQLALESCNRLESHVVLVTFELQTVRVLQALQRHHSGDKEPALPRDTSVIEASLFGRLDGSIGGNLGYSV